RLPAAFLDMDDGYIPGVAKQSRMLNLRRSEGLSGIPSPRFHLSNPLIVQRSSTGQPALMGKVNPPKSETGNCNGTFRITGLGELSSPSTLLIFKAGCTSTLIPSISTDTTIPGIMVYM